MVFRRCCEGAAEKKRATKYPPNPPLHYQKNLPKPAGNDSRLQHDLMSGYYTVALIQGNASMANLRETDGAMQNYQKGLAIAQRLAAASPNDPEIQAWPIKFHMDIAILHESMCHNSDALREL